MCTKSYVHRTSSDPGYAAKQAEEIQTLHLMDQFIFVPGIFGTVGLELLKKLEARETSNKLSYSTNCSCSNNPTWKCGNV